MAAEDLRHLQRFDGLVPFRKVRGYANAGLWTLTLSITIFTKKHPLTKFVKTTTHLWQNLPKIRTFSVTNPGPVCSDTVIKWRIAPKISRNGDQKVHKYPFSYIFAGKIPLLLHFCWKNILLLSHFLLKSISFKWHTHGRAHIVRARGLLRELTGLKKSPIHFAMMSDSMMGMPNVMSPVHSITITVRLIVILTVPPSWHAAPIKMYLVISVPCNSNKSIDKQPIDNTKLVITST